MLYGAHEINGLNAKSITAYEQPFVKARPYQFEEAVATIPAGRAGPTKIFEPHESTHLQNYPIMARYDLGSAAERKAAQDEWVEYFSATGRYASGKADDLRFLKSMWLPDFIVPPLFYHDMQKLTQYFSVTERLEICSRAFQAMIAHHDVRSYEAEFRSTFERTVFGRSWKQSWLDLFLVKPYELTRLDLRTLDKLSKPSLAKITDEFDTSHSQGLLVSEALFLRHGGVFAQKRNVAMKRASLRV